MPVFRSMEPKKKKHRNPTPLNASDMARMDLLVSIAALHYNTTADKIMSDRQYGKYPEIRYVIIHIAHKNKVVGTTQIGLYFGKNNQSISPALKKINNFLKINDPEILAAIQFIEISFLIIHNKTKKTNMEVLTVTNGIVQVVLVPQNEQECATLRRLLEEGPLDVHAVSGNLNILGIPLQDGIIIRQKQKEVNNANG